MPDTKLSNISPAASVVLDADILYIVQSATSMKVTAQLLKDFAADGAQKLGSAAITQTAHSFSVKQAVRKGSDDVWVTAQAITSTTVASVTGVVSEVIDANNFRVVTSGKLTATGMTAGYYYLSAATAGLLTQTSPTGASEYQTVVMRATSATEAYVNISAPLPLQAIPISDLAVDAAVAALLDDTSVGAMRATLGLAVGTDVQAYDADLAAVAALSSTGIARRTGAGTWSAGTAVNLATEVSGVLPVANFATGSPTGTKFVRDDGVLAVPAGGGGTGESLRINGGTSATDYTHVEVISGGNSATDYTNLVHFHGGNSATTY